MSKELALKIADEERIGWVLGLGGMPEFLHRFATRYHAAMMEKYGNGFDARMSDAMTSMAIPTPNELDWAECGYQAGAASREQEVQALQDKYDAACQRWHAAVVRKLGCLNAWYQLNDELTATREALAEAQAKIDSLMLEYCPGEMTPKQLDEWAKHQRPVDADTQDAINQTLNSARKEG